MASTRRKSPQTRTQALASFLDTTLLPDLRERAKEPGLLEVLRERWQFEQKARRTAATFDEWCDQTLTQVGVAWVLGAVFVRVLEDRGLMVHRRLAGGDATDSEQLFTEMFAGLGPRDYLLATFTEVSHAPVARDLLGPQGNPAWKLGPSHPSARALLDLLRVTEPDGTLRWRFDDPDTRFLGDLYQDLSADVRERYALLQTPDFVESFILDRTLEPAIETFGLGTVRVLDPTCGSGHFLLGAFGRFVKHLQHTRPAADPREIAHEALSKVYGSDINPYAVAIARFRLLLAYVEMCGLKKLADAPALPSLTQNLVVADSLRRRKEVTRSFAAIVPEDARQDWGPRSFDFEEPEAVQHVFDQRYHAVVGNPPYIVCRDAALREMYREWYPDSAQRQFALGAPFTERFFKLAVEGGYVGLINANSFMKREFGKGLVEKVLSKLDLTVVVDTSGTYIPGHGTPTVILFGRHRRPGDLTPQPPLPRGRGGAEEEEVRIVNTRRYVDPALLEAARRARKEPTPAEAAAWELLRDRRTLGLKFRRQQVIEGVYADLYCPALSLVLELDGGIHLDPNQRAYDAARTKVLEAWGLRVIRLKNEQVSQAGLTQILSPLSPSGEGGRGGEVTAGVRVVMGRRGEPETPAVPAKGKVWSSIVEHIDDVGYENEFITVADVPRETLAKHPWSLGGGGAGALKELIEKRAEKRLSDIALSIGRVAHTGADEAFVADHHSLFRQGLTTEQTTSFVEGEVLRDWMLGATNSCVFPYTDGDRRCEEKQDDARLRYLWPHRTALWLRREPNGTHREIGLTWYEFSRFHPERYAVGFCIGFAFVATHNHFVLDRGGKVFKQSAPIIKLPATATEDDHLALLAWLNSSTAATALRCTCSSKGAQGINEGIKTELWEQFLEYSGGNVERLAAPSPDAICTEIARSLDALARERESFMPRAALERYIPTRDGAVRHYLDRARTEADARLARMVALQEELDWRWYDHLGILTDAERTKHRATRDAAIPEATSPPPVRAGHRAFERALMIAHEGMAGGSSASTSPRASAPPLSQEGEGLFPREQVDGHLSASQAPSPPRERGRTEVGGEVGAIETAWFTRNGYALPTDEAMAQYPAAMQALVKLRCELIAGNRMLALVERPEHKRRWTLRDFDAEARDAAAALLLDRAEAAIRHAEAPVEARVVVAELVSDATAQALASVCFPDVADPIESLPTLMASESVAYLAAMRHTEEGLAKRAKWEHTWALQRREDAGEKVGEIPVPPKYDREDWRDGRYWSLRGKLDVPRERFIAYPGAETDARTPLYGWAGWNHLQRARALAALYQQRKTQDGWDRERLLPLLAGLAELLPWIKQWHDEPDPELDGMRQGALWAEFLEGERGAHGLSEKDLNAWRPASVRKTQRARPTVLPLTRVRETVADAVRAFLAQKGARAEDYCAQQQIPVGVVERMLSSELPFDPQDVSTTALALMKGTAHDESHYFKVLSEIERSRLKPTRARPIAKAARKKRSEHEP